VPEDMKELSWPTIDEMLKKNKQIEAIREYRTATYADLSQAVQAIKKRRIELGLRPRIEARIDEINLKVVVDGPDGIKSIKITELYDLLS
jgi:hypothetical protein